MNRPSPNPWLRISLYNLALVAFLGVLMRYKIAFAFPFVEQKYLLHAHSHFAFAGWITHTFMVLIWQVLRPGLGPGADRTYRNLVLGNLVCAYGMLFSFAAQGYGPVSIPFSTLSVFFLYGFSLRVWLDTRPAAGIAGSNWFRAAVTYATLSSAGTFYLAWMMATRQADQHLYLASVYFYLHFQYNGWFFLACLGLISNKWPVRDPKTLRYAFPALAFTCLPAYLLSVLWWPLPTAWIVLTGVVAAVQVAGWVLFLRGYAPLILDWLRDKGTLIRWLFIGVLLATSIKFLLQLVSTHPQLSQLAFGFRPIVIAYLHLVLLGMISLFLLTYLKGFYELPGKVRGGKFLWIFFIAVFGNEFTLMVQGIASLDYFALPGINLILFGIAILLFVSAAGMALSSREKT